LWYTGYNTVIGCNYLPGLLKYKYIG